MAAPSSHSQKIIERLRKELGGEVNFDILAPKTLADEPLPPLLPNVKDYTTDAYDRRIELLSENGVKTKTLNSESRYDSQTLKGNIENFIGVAKVPVGVIGPLRINGVSAQGDFYVPLATSEGTLVASYNRGAHVISQSGGASVVCLTESVTRAPCFQFNDIREAGAFLTHVLSRIEDFQEIVSTTSAHCKFLDLKPVVNGKEIHLIFEYTTGDASGQNMVTIATYAVVESLLKQSPVTPRKWYLDGNMSGDKKATMNSFLYTRGKKVVAEVSIESDIVQRCLHTTAQEMFNYWQISFMGGMQSGSIGSQGHFANGLAALFIACGQDVACVAEASIGVTRISVNEDNSLYVSVSLPNVIVGTVGGGTSLPTSRECLEMIDCYGKGKARKFAELCAVTVLAGEISMIGSFAANDFAQAHSAFGRNKFDKNQ